MTTTGRVGKGTERQVMAHVQQLRTARGWSRRDLAARMQARGVGWTFATIGYLERPNPCRSRGGSHRQLTLDEAVALADVFDMTIGQLVDEAQS